MPFPDAPAQPGSAANADAQLVQALLTTTEDLVLLVDASLCVRSGTRAAIDLTGLGAGASIADAFTGAGAVAEFIRLLAEAAAAPVAPPLAEVSRKCSGLLQCVDGASMPAEAELTALGDGSLLLRFRVDPVSSQAVATMPSNPGLQWAQRSTNEGTWSWKIAERQLVLSSAAFRIAGFGDTMVVDTADWFVDRVHRADRQALFRAVAVALDTRSPLRVEFRFRSRSGVYRWLQVRGEGQWDRAGTAVWLAGAVTDITEQKVSESVLKDTVVRLQAVLEHAADGIVTFDGEGIVRSFNTAAERIFGLSQAEVLGRNIGSLLQPPNDAPPTSDWCALYVVGEGRDTIGRRPGGEQFPAIVAVTRMQLANADMYTAVIRDASEQRQFECELMQAKEHAEAAARTRSDFLARMSHEIRTPMNGVIGMAQLLLDMTLSPPQREAVDLIRASGDALLNIIDDILDFAKIEAGKMTLVNEPFDPRECVHAVCALLANRAEEKGIGLRVNCTPEVPELISGDAGRLRQVLFNLIGNALKFTAVGEVRVNLAWDTGELHLTVEDTGIGFDPAIMTRLFEPFSQAETSTSRRFGGTGLGLAISRELCELMGGRIEIDQHREQGAAVHVTVPLALVAVVDDDLATEPPQGPAAPRVGDEASSDPSLTSAVPAGVVAMTGPAAPLPARLPSAPKVLLAEDNQINQTVAVRMLERLGCEVDLVPNGRAAISRFVAGNYELVLMDCQMPIMDGLDATIEIRRIERTRRTKQPIPIIAMTANAMHGDRERCLSAGMSDYLAKPIRTAELAATLERWRPRSEPGAESLNAVH